MNFCAKMQSRQGSRKSSRPVLTSDFNRLKPPLPMPTTRCLQMRVTLPPPLRTSYRPILALRLAYRYFLASRTAYRLTTKKNHFGRFHLHKEDKITICCMHMYNHC